MRIIIVYLNNKFFVLSKQKKDNAGRILILDMTVDADKYVLIDFYNASTKAGQVKILEKL